jgi:rhodanese-related sulfurtransferase
MLDVSQERGLLHAPPPATDRRRAPWGPDRGVAGRREPDAGRAGDNAPAGPISPLRIAMNTLDRTPTDTEPDALEISLASATELCRLGMGTMVDIRQTFEIELKGSIPGTVHIPLFEVKQLLGHALTEDEQDILDAGKPSDIDVQGFFTMINRLHHAHDNILLCVCNSGRRSLYAAKLLRSLGYGKALSVAGGFQAWKLLQAQRAAAPVQPSTHSGD